MCTHGFTLTLRQTARPDHHGHWPPDAQRHHRRRTPWAPTWVDTRPHTANPTALPEPGLRLAPGGAHLGTSRSAATRAAGQRGEPRPAATPPAPDTQSRGATQPARRPPRGCDRRYLRRGASAPPWPPPSPAPSAGREGGSERGGVAGGGGAGTALPEPPARVIKNPQTARPEAPPASASAAAARPGPRAGARPGTRERRAPPDPRPAQGGAAGRRVGGPGRRAVGRGRRAELGGRGSGPRRWGGGGV